MAREWTETLSTLHATEDGKALEGIVVPYGVVTADARRHGFAPGAFADSVAHWMSRTDGARMGFRLDHGARPIGTVPVLTDTPDGVWARVELFDSEAAQAYRTEVAAGLNGVSVEVGNAGGGKRLRDGSTIYGKATLHAIAGSMSPAFEGARVSLHDLEEPVNETPDPTPPAPEPPPEPAPAVELHDRKEAERTALQPYTGIVQTRPDFIYGRHNGPTFFNDGWRASKGDSAAAERQERHYAMLADIATTDYAGDVLSSEIPAAYPSIYTPGLLVSRIMKNRPMGNFFTRVGLTDARPRIIPTVTTSTTVAVQSAEAVNPVASDFATTSQTVTPLLYGAETLVSRQVLDGADPDAERMIFTDMIQAYVQASEVVIRTAVEAGSAASGVAITAATPYAGFIGNAIAFQTARFRAPEGIFIPSALYAVAIAQADTAGRPLIPWLGPTNSDARTDGTTGAVILNTAAYLSYASTVNVVVTANRDDFVILESNIVRFNYTEGATAPSAVRLGVWAYLVVAKRLGSLKVTAA